MKVKQKILALSLVSYLLASQNLVLATNPNVPPCTDHSQTATKPTHKQCVYNGYIVRVLHRFNNSVVVVPKDEANITLGGEISNSYEKKACPICGHLIADTTKPIDTSIYHKKLESLHIHIPEFEMGVVKNYEFTKQVCLCKSGCLVNVEVHVIMDGDNDGLLDLDEKHIYKTSWNKADTDNDGLTDKQEIDNGLNPLVSNIGKDSDNDSLSDIDEVKIHGSHPLKIDSDGDGLSDSIEVNTYHTSPSKVDTDNDGLTDKQEIKYGLNPLIPDADSDKDNDGLTDKQEIDNGLNPLVANSTTSDLDGDSLTDIDEVKIHHTNPLKADSDGDGLNDNLEILTHHTNPLKKDTDNDTLTDKQEIDADLNPLIANAVDSDLDGDGLTDIREAKLGLNPHVSNIGTDVDNDGMNDIDEVNHGLNPIKSNINSDLDDDGINDLDEIAQELDPLNSDSDGDGMNDGWEIANGWNPKIKDNGISFPYSETFNKFNNGNINQQYNWSLVQGVVEIVSNKDVNNSGKSIKIISNTERSKVSRVFKNIKEDKIWIDFSTTIKPNCNYNILDFAELEVDNDSNIKFKTIGNDDFVIIAATKTELTDDYDWEKFSLLINVANSSYKLFLNKSQIAQGNLTINNAYLRTFSITGNTSSDIYFDELSVKLEDPNFYDTDGDGLTNEKELTLGSDPNNVDTDGDGLNDGIESKIRFCENPEDIILENGTMPSNWYLDGNANWTLQQKTVKSGNYALKSGDIGDSQNSAISFSGEYENGDKISFWYKMSSDNGDRLIFHVDGQNIASWSGETDWILFTYSVNPGFHDIELLYRKDEYGSMGSDCAWVDFVEPYKYLDITNADTDNDKMPDGWEHQHNLNGTNASDASLDSDNDGLTNLQEYQNKTNPHNADSDGDGIKDGWEVNNKLNANDANDASLDSDNDGLTNLQESQNNTDPHNSDSDNDGMNDNWELQNGFNPTTDDSTLDANNNNVSDHWEKHYGITDVTADDDNDGLTNLQEYQQKTNPKKSDTDGDGVIDNIDTNPTTPDGWNDVDGPAINIKIKK